MSRTRALALALFSLSLAACRSGGPSTPAAQEPAPTTTAPAVPAPPEKAGAIGPDPTLDGGSDTRAAPGPSFVQHQAPPPCSPHVDGSDPEHKLAPVETVYRRTTVDGKPVLDILLVDVPGACEFDTRRPASYRAVRVRLAAPQAGAPNAHYVIGETSALATFAFSGPGRDGGTDENPAKSGIIDLMETQKDGSLSVGFNVKTATGESFGCFIAKPCP